MQRDLKDSLMMIAKGDLVQYEKLHELSAKDFLIKYKSFIREIETEQ